RPGAKESVDRLKDAGWSVWAFTSGTASAGAGYLEKGGIAIDDEYVMTCDDIGVGKPEIRAYEGLKERIGTGDEPPWFAAALGWHVSAAGRVGFRTAYCTVLEKEALEDIFGTMEITADSLAELAEKIIGAA
ncbi:hypothetical protein EJ07DRAFT_130881, partial [Lizonia empirigonia]